MSVSGLDFGQVSPARHPRNPLSRRRIETVAVRSSAFFGLIFGAQTLPFMLDQLSIVDVGWSYAVIIAIFGGLIFSVFAVLIPRLSPLVRPINAYIAVVYLLALVTWPLSVPDPSLIQGGKPWLWYLCTLATAMAAVAFSVWVASAYLVITPIIYGIIHSTPAGGNADWTLSVLDIVYAVILGGAVLVILTLLRQTAASVDAAQSTALARYAHAVRQHATESERVQVDAIVHDSVLTTLLSAARAYTPDAQVLAASMAANTIGHLRDAAAVLPDDVSTVSMQELSERILVAASGLPSSFGVRSSGIRAGVVPTQAAEALFSAAVQAMVNSVQHAGSGSSVARWVAVTGEESGGLRIEIGDTGVGFDVSSVPMERLGLRVSIVERVVSAGGAASVDSVIDQGTTVTIRWPAHPFESGEPSS